MMLEWLWDKIREEYKPDKKIDIKDLEPEFRKDMREYKNAYYILSNDFC